MGVKTCTCALAQSVMCRDCMHGWTGELVIDWVGRECARFYQKGLGNGMKHWRDLFFYVQVRDAAINSLVEIYRHVGERVRADLSKKGLPQSR